VEEFVEVDALIVGGRGCNLKVLVGAEARDAVEYRGTERLVAKVEVGVEALSSTA